MTLSRTIEGFRLADIVETRPDLKIPERLHAMEQLRQTYFEIGAQSDNPTHIIYPAGACNIFPFFMPSLRVLSILDIAPLFNPEINPASGTMQTILSEHTNQYVNLATLLDDPRIAQDQSAEVTRRMGSSIGQALKMPIEGFFVRRAREAKVRDIEHFTNILGALLIMDVDLSTVRIGQFAEEYRIQFMRGNDVCYVRYREGELNSQNRKSYDSRYKKLPRRLRKYANNAALLIRGDAGGIGGGAVHAFNPETIICDSSHALFNLTHFSTDYEFQHLQNPTYPNLPWGYFTPSDILIGKRVRSTRRG